MSRWPGSRATTFPVDLWAWGAADRTRASLDDRLAAWCAALCIAAAFLPVIALGVVLDGVTPSARLSGFLYLATMPLMLLFLRVQTRRREEPGRAAKRRDSMYRPNEGGVP